MGLRFSSNIQSHESVNWLTLAAPTGFLVLYRIVRIAQDHPAGWYYISLRSLTTELKEPNQRCTTDANRWKCVSDRRAGRTLRVLLALRVVPQGEARGTIPTPMQPRVVRCVKYLRVYGETLYADRMYQEHVGTTTAAVTARCVPNQAIVQQLPTSHRCFARKAPTPDHLGSTNWVTDHQGEGYEHFTYTPYGEAWVEEHLSSKIHRVSHRFTGQELDPETGLYAFPARNYDPRTSRWLSTDPALEEYLPIAPTSDEAREHNQNLPGMGVCLLR